MVTVFAVIAGWLFGLVSKMNTGQRYVTAIEFPVRNAGIAAVVATACLGHPEYAAFSALFVGVSVPGEGKYGTYTLFQKNGQDMAGMMNPTPDTPSEESYWHSYISVDDVDLCAERAFSLGGKIVVPPHDVPDVRRICIVEDPTGAIAHLTQPSTD